LQAASNKSNENLFAVLMETLKENAKVQRRYSILTNKSMQPVMQSAESNFKEFVKDAAIDDTFSYVFNYCIFTDFYILTKLFSCNTKKSVIIVGDAHKTELESCLKEAGFKEQISHKVTAKSKVILDWSRLSEEPQAVFNKRVKRA